MTSRGILGYISSGRNPEVFDRFKEFKALVENQTEKIIKVLRTDNGKSSAGMNLKNYVRSAV
jgi:hypothetical protein